jgi:hypothetical protein
MPGGRLDRVRHPDCLVSEQVVHVEDAGEALGRAVVNGLLVAGRAAGVNGRIVNRQDGWRRS